MKLFPLLQAAFLAETSRPGRVWSLWLASRESKNHRLLSPDPYLAVTCWSLPCNHSHKRAADQLFFLGNGLLIFTALKKLIHLLIISFLFFPSPFCFSYKGRLLTVSRTSCLSQYFSFFLCNNDPLAIF